jgi:hypothetical protein
VHLSSILQEGIRSYYYIDSFMLEGISPERRHGLRTVARQQAKVARRRCMCRALV